jgi:predicted Rossmann fold nucleotide-binding protein DprA/Smf involved in DNA uptake
MKLAIVGYRNYVDYAAFSLTVDSIILALGKPDEIISGGCTGADRMAERYAKEHGITMTVLKPDERIKNNSRFAIRDKEIAKQCTHMIAFPSKLGKGTQLTIGFAEKQKRTVFVYWI